MPPEPIALDSSDEDEKRYPLLRHRRSVKREQTSDSEVDELLSDADDDYQAAPTAPPPPRTSPSRSGKSSADRSKSARKLKKERHKAKKKRKLERNREREEGHKAVAVVEKQKESSNAAAAAPREAARPLEPAHDAAPLPRIDDEVGEDGDDSLPSLVVPSQAGPSNLPAAPVEDDEAEVDEDDLFASQSAQTRHPDGGDDEHDELDELQAEHGAHSGEAVTAPPEECSAAPGQDPHPAPGGGASDPIELPTSPPPVAEDDAADDASISDASSITYSEDSQEYEEGATFYTSSEGSLHGSDSEDGLGSWTERDQDKWQGSTAHLDEAYDGNFEVRAVLRHRKHPRRGFMQYRTVWAGYPIYSTTWEPESHFNNPKTLHEYWQRQGGRPMNVRADYREYSTHDSDTDRAVMRRPRRRAHEALKKKRREIRRDKVDLRQYMNSLNDKRAKAKAKEEQKYEEFRRVKRLELDTERTREKGTSRSYQKRLEKQQQKRWRRTGRIDGADAGDPSRFSTTQANRSMADVSMKARAGASTAARTRVSQLDDSIPENDENQLVFRRSAPGSGPNFPGLSASMAGPSRSGTSSGSVRPIAGPSAMSRPAGGSGSASASSVQAPAPRPPPGSYKGQHHRGPKVQIKDDFSSFLNKIHNRAPPVGPSQPLLAPTDSDGRPVTAKRRNSEAKRGNLLVLQPVKDFKGGSRPAAPFSTSVNPHPASSEAGDDEPFDIPEMSAVRGQFNPHQPVSDTDEVRKANTAPKRSSLASQASAYKAPQTRTEDPRRGPQVTIVPAREQPAPRTAPSDDGGWSPMGSNTAGWEMDPGPGFSPVTMTPRSPLGGEFHGPAQGSPWGPAPQHVVFHGWFELVANDSFAFEGALRSEQPIPTARSQTLGLADRVTTVRFDRAMPFAWIRDVLAAPEVAWHEAMLLGAQGPAAIRDRDYLDRLSEVLKVSDMALLSSVDSLNTTENGETQSTGPEYLVAFSSTYALDPVAGIPHALQSMRGHASTLCVMPLRLNMASAPSERVPFRRYPPLEPSIASIFDTSVGKKTIEDLRIGRNEMRKVKMAAQRYGIVQKLYEGIRSSYNVVFLGRNPPTYEKSVLYYIVRVFEGGVRLELDPVKDAKLYKDPKIGINVFVRNAALSEILDASSEQKMPLGQYLRRFKRQPRCKFWTFGFSPEDPDERIREIFPGHDGLVTYSMSAILADLVRSSTVEKQVDEGEEGQLTQQNDNEPRESILRNTVVHLPHSWRLRLHPWIRPCFKLLADQLETVCRSLQLIDEDQEFPLDLTLELDSKLDEIYSAVGVDEWPSDAINGQVLDEPSEVPEEPEALVAQIDEEVFATLRKRQLGSVRITRFHVMVSGSRAAEERDEAESAGIEMVDLAEYSENACSKLASLPGN